MLRAARTLTVLATFAFTASCQTVRDPLPGQAALNLDVTDTAVASQRAPLPAPQVVIWKVDEATIENVPGLTGSYSFLYSGACSYQLNAAAPVSFQNACHTSGLTLSPGTSFQSATVRLTISRLEVRAAARADLSASADPDGDGVPNAGDNCPIVSNPDQANVNPGEAIQVGDACSMLDLNGFLTVGDEDRDRVADVIDNCLWYPNPPLPGTVVPPDTDRDGIGDACERIAPVVLPGRSLTIQCDGVGLTAPGNTLSVLRVDFGQPGALTCDAGFSGCTINPSAVRLLLAGTSTTFECHQAS